MQLSLENKTVLENASVNITQRATQIELVYKPTISNITARGDQCSPPQGSGSPPDYTCPQYNYSIRIQDLKLKTKNETINAVFSVSFKGQEWLLNPCSDNGCQITKEGNVTSINIDFSGALESLTPTLNMKHLSNYESTVYSNQRIYLGNYSITVKMLPYAGILSNLISQRAIFVIECPRNVQLLKLGVGESDFVDMCGGTVKIEVPKNLTPLCGSSSTENSINLKARKICCVNITTSRGTEMPAKESIFVNVWKLDQDFISGCSNGNLGSSGTGKVEFISREKLTNQTCMDHYLGSFEFQADVEEWNSNGWIAPGC